MIQSAAALEDHIQCWNCFRNADFSSLPVEVWGKLGTKMNSSGTCHLANLQVRNERSSSGVTWQPSLRTTAASGLSCHLGCGAATTAASFTAGWATRAFSTSTELIHSPPDLIRSLVRSVIFI